MTNPQIPPNNPESTTPETPEPPKSLPSRFWGWLKRPSTLIGAGTLVVAVVGGSIVGYSIIRRQLPSWIGTQLENILDRPVTIGEFEELSLAGIRIGASEMPATETDADRVSIEAIDIEYDLRPLLTQRRLPVIVTIVEPTAYFDQDEDGVWFELDLESEEEFELPELPIDLDATARVERAEIVLLPQGLNAPVEVRADVGGELNYPREGEKQLGYDIDAEFADAPIQIQGRTELERFTTQAEVAIANLSLVQLTALVDDLPVSLDSGRVDIDLAIDLPSLEAYRESQVNGRIDIQAVAGRVEIGENNVAPVAVDLGLRFQEQEVDIAIGQASLGGILVSVSGGADLQTGYDLQVDVSPFSLDTILAFVPELELPVPTAGEFQLGLNVSGDNIEDPQLRALFEATRPTRIDQIELATLIAEVNANLERTAVDRLEITPATGGQVLAQGIIETNLREAIEAGDDIDFSQWNIDFQAEADLALDAIAAAYKTLLPGEFRLGSFNGDLRVGGTIGTPEVLANWELVETFIASVGDISGRGEARFDGTRFSLRDTGFQTDLGDIGIFALGNLETQEWVATVNSDSVALDPVISELIEQGELESIDLLDLDIRLAGALDSLTPEDIQGSADVTVALQGRAIGFASARSAIDVEGTLERGILQGLVRGQRLDLLPFVSLFVPEVNVPLEVRQLRADIRGDLAPLLRGEADAIATVEGIEATLETILEVDRSPIAVDTVLNRGRLQGLVTAGELDLLPFITAFVPNIEVPLSVRELRAEGEGDIIPFLAGEADAIAALEGVEATVAALLNIDRSAVDLDAFLVRGQLGANIVSTSAIALSEFLPDLPVEAIFEGGTASATGTISGLLQAANEGDLAGLSAETDLSLTVSEGAIALRGQLQDGFWDAIVLASDINTTQLSRPFLANLNPQAPPLEFPRFNADIALSGEANSLVRGDRASVNVEGASLEWGEQIIEANGVAILADLFAAPDIAEAELAVNANLDFNSLPTTKILDLVPTERQYLPQSLELAGESNFSGRISARQLLQAPTAPNSLVLEGDILLTDFEFNDLVFDPVMTGTVNFATGDEAELVLRGENDAIIAAVDPCLSAECLAPYNLNTLELRRERGTDDSILILATGNENSIAATIENFPLSVLRLAPAEEFGFPGAVVGTVNLEANLNLEDLAANGEVQILEPGIGNAGVEEFATAFSYIDNEARISEGRLEVGRNRFDFEGNYNLNSGAIGANLTLEEGKIEDLIAAANISSVEDLSRFTQPLNGATTADIGAIALGVREDAPIGAELELYEETVRQVQARAAQLRNSGVPNRIDIRGDLALEANLTGTLNNPQANLTVSGQGWDVRPRSSFRDYLPSLGLVIEDAGIVRINELSVAANYENGVGTLDEATVIIGGGTISASGQVNPVELSGEARIENLSLDPILEVVSSPVDAAGEINLEVALSGSPQSPEVQGTFSLNNSSFQGRAIEEDFAGEFSYSDLRLELQTTNPSDIQVRVNGDIALPPQPDFENRIVADVNIGESGFALIGALSTGQVEWVEGGGEIVISAETFYTDDPSAAIENFDLTGRVTFDNAVVLTTALAENLTLNGEVELREDRVRIEQLRGTVDETEIAIAGVFPLLTPLNPEDPDAANASIVATIDRGEIDLENLYRGRVDAEVIVGGIALNPIIGGEVRLYDGRVFIPQRTQAATSAAYNRWFGDFAELQGEPPVAIELDDFQVVLGEDFGMVSSPVYNFSMSGDLTLNGSPLDIPNLRSSGVIVLERGEITLFNTDIFLSRLNENRVVFDASRPILNPELDIEMGTTISDPTGIGQPTSPNEIRDDLTRVGQSETVTVTLLVQGQAEELLASLGAVPVSDACERGAEDFFSPLGGAELSQSNLEQEEACVSNRALTANNGSSQEILESPAVELSSSPPRTRGQIIELLGQQFIGLAEQLEQSSGEELLQFGATEFVIEPLTRDIIFLVNEEATKFARPRIGVSQARIYPQLEGIYRLEGDTIIGVSYDYLFQQVEVRYERFF